ncbi:MAG: hypothetical protein ABI618_12035 [Nitrospirota bacterium]
MTGLIPNEGVILSQRRRICAQVDDATAERDPSVDLALSFAEWVRMACLSGQLFIVDRSLFGKIRVNG